MKMLITKAVFAFSYSIFFSLLFLSISHDAQADISYTFITVSCLPKEMAASIIVTHEYNETGKNKDTNNVKDVYSMGARDGNETQKNGSCDIGTHENISFNARQYDLPKKDSLTLSLNNVNLDKNFSLEDNWTMNVQYVANQEFKIKYCPENLANITELSPDDVKKFYTNKKTACQYLVILNGQVASSKIINESASN